MQRHDRLARAGAAVDDERAARARAHDRVLVGLDRAEHVAHPRRPARAEARDERRLVVERRARPRAVGHELLVPVVGDAPARPPVPAPRREAERLRGRGREVRLGGGRAPVDEQALPRRVGEAHAAHVHRGGAVGEGHAAQAQVDAVALEQAQPAAEAVDLLVALERLGAAPARRAPGRVETLREVGHRVLEARGDRREVALVGVDQRRVGLRGQPRGQVEERLGPRVLVRGGVGRRAAGRVGGGGHGGVGQRHQLRSGSCGGTHGPRRPAHERRFCAPEGALPQDPRCAIRWRGRPVGPPSLVARRLAGALGADALGTDLDRPASARRRTADMREVAPYRARRGATSRVSTGPATGSRERVSSRRDPRASSP